VNIRIRYSVITVRLDVSRPNRYLPSLAVLSAISVLAVMLFPTMVSAGALPSYDRVRILEPARQLQSAVLLDANGQQSGFDRLLGKVTFVFFGFTQCPDICPLTMQRFRELHESGLVDPDDVVFVLISVDGERDTPDAMKRYLAGYSPDFIGLTGDPKEVKKLAAQFRAPFYKGNEVGAAPQGYTVAHSPQVYIVDATGALRAEFYNASMEAMAGIAKALVAEQSAIGTDTDAIN